MTQPKSETEYLNELRRRLRWRVRPNRVKEILSEARAHLRSCVDDIRAEHPNPEEEAIHRYGDVRHVANQHIFAETKQSIRQNALALLVLAPMGVWPVLGSVVDAAYSNSWNPWAFYTFVFGLPAMHAIAFAIIAFRSRRILWWGSLGGYVIAGGSMAILCGYLFVIAFPEEGHGLFLRSRSQEYTNQFAVTVPKLLEMKTLCDAADDLYLRNRSTPKVPLHNSGAYIVPVKLNINISAHLLDYSLGISRVSSLNAAKQLWKSSHSVKGEVNDRYNTELLFSRAFARGVHRPPLDQVPGLLSSSLGESYVVLGFLLVLNAIPFLAGLAIDHARTKRLQPA